MKISLHWLKEFVEFPFEPRRLKADLTMLGLNVESFSAVGDDWVLDVEVTTNRPDCLSHYGVARELATLYRQSLKSEEVAVQEAGKPASAAASIEIADPELCARYCGRVVQNVQVRPSPSWLVQRLEAIGQRPINNVADITNYVLMEMGHPLHAFDLSRLKRQSIIVRRAKPGEPLRTLDRVDRTLTPEDLVIADGERPVALAGVMGGEETEISPSTRAVLLESAWFNPLSVRRTAKSQGMHTEASHRFERGADIEMAPRALDRAAELIQKLAQGEVLQGILDVYPRPQPRPELELRRSEILRILGAEVSMEEVERILCGLFFTIQRQGAEGWRVTPPSFRLDVSLEVDLIEEVARHFGYDRLPSRLRPAPPPVERDAARDKIIVVSSLLVGLGYHEIITPTLVDPAESERFGSRPPVVLENPLSQDASAMRSSAVPSMLRALRWNLDRDLLDVGFFEIGKTYGLRGGLSPEEYRVLSLGATGHLRPASIYDSEKTFDFFDLKGDLETIFSAFELPKLDFEPAESPFCERGGSGCMSFQGVALARFGQIRGDAAREYKLRQPVWVAEIDLERLLDFPLRSRQFRSLSKFPAVERDFSLILPEAVPFARLSTAIAGLALEEMRSFRPVDFFRGGAIPCGHYSLLLRVTFQSQSHTLTNEEAGELSQRLLAALEPLGVTLRG